MPIWSSLNDKCWPFADALHLGNFFDKHNIPPVVLPIAIVLIAAAIFLFFLTPSGLSRQEDLSCGDSACDPDIGEDLITCPEDCASTGESLNTVIVKLTGEVKNSIEVRLEDYSGAVVNTAQGSNSEFTFTGVPKDSIKAVIKNPRNSQTASSNFVSVSGTTTITLSIPSSFFNEPASAKGMLKVQVKDALTGAQLSARVKVVIPNGNSYVVAETQDITSVGTFTLDSGQWYALIATPLQDGYREYAGLQNRFQVEAGGETIRQIQMELSMPSAAPSYLHVCVQSRDGGTPAGFAAVSSLAGAELSELPLQSGCADFELSEGTFTISTTLFDCSNAESQVTLGPGGASETLTVSCGLESLVRVKLTNSSGAVLTRNATIMLWRADGNKVSGTGPSGALANGTDNYTEFVRVDPSMQFYFVVAGLDGYAVYTSEDYSIEPGENRSIVLTLESMQPSYNFTFVGVTYPPTVGAGRPFFASFAKVLYGQTDITQIGNITVSVNGVHCNLTNKTASCPAPAQPGTHDIVFSAAYSGKSGTDVRHIDVIPYSPSSSLFQLIPHASFDTEPPITFEFDIKFNGTLLGSLDDSNAAFYYAGGAVSAGSTKLSGGSGLYSMTANSPYPGEHEARIYLMVVRSSGIYEQNFTYEFESYPASTSLTLENSINPRILAPGQAYNIYARLKNGAIEVPNLENLFVTVDGQATPLSWDSSGHVYKKAFVAPQSEGIYPVAFKLESFQLASSKIYVVDTSKEKSGSCEIASCGTIPEVRRCVYKFKQESAYSEQETIACIEAGWFAGGADFPHCRSGSANRGDWDNSCALGGDDADLMTEFLSKITSQSERSSYAACGDMNNDGVIDAQDVTCIQRVASGAWYGDKSTDYAVDGCAPGMKGGFCFDIRAGSPGDFDGDGNFTSKDAAIMANITRSVSAGVAVPQAIMDSADFNRDAAINSADASCLSSIIAGPIQVSCLNIFNFGCGSTKGDLDRDGFITETDLMFEGWIVGGRLTPNACADMNADGEYTDIDYNCISSIVVNDPEGVEEFCTSCIDKQTELGRYGDEICNDGEDNNCNGAVDEGCECNDETPCDKLWDGDSVPDTDDFKSCVLRSWGSGNRWGWYSETELEGFCEKCEDVNRAFNYCGKEVKCIAKCDGSVQWHSADPPFEWVTPLEGFDFSIVSCGGLAYFLANLGPGQPGAYCCDGSKGASGCGTHAEGSCPAQVNGANVRKLGTTYDCPACCVETSKCSGCPEVQNLGVFLAPPNCISRASICQNTSDATKYGNCMSAVGCSTAGNERGSACTGFAQYCLSINDRASNSLNNFYNCMNNYGCGKVTTSGVSCNPAVYSFCANLTNPAINPVLNTQCYRDYWGCPVPTFQTSATCDPIADYCIAGSDRDPSNWVGIYMQCMNTYGCGNGVLTDCDIVRSKCATIVGGEEAPYYSDCTRGWGC